MKLRFILLSSLFIIGCSSGSSGGDEISGGGNNNGGGNTGGNTGGNSDGETDPDKYTDSSSSGNTTYYISFSGGDLDISWKDDNNIVMTGPYEIEEKLEIDISDL